MKKKEMSLLDAIKIVLEFINDAEYALESLDCTKKEWKQFDDAIERLQDEVTQSMIDKIKALKGK